MAGGARDLGTDLEGRMPKATEQTHSNPAPSSTRPRGFALERFNTRPGVDPMSELEWDLRTAVITGEDGRVVFEQKDVEVPRAWSQTATNVVVSKYFRGPLKEDPHDTNGPKRETSVRQLVLRVVDTIAGWGEKQAYFADLRCARDLPRRAAASAAHAKGLVQQPGLLQCRHRRKTAVLRMLHPQGRRFDGVDPWLVSQRGDDLQRRLRLGRQPVIPCVPTSEKLSSGGTASGPLSFMKAADASAGVIKSGGKTRRAAKMVVLNADHPDIKRIRQLQG